MTAAQRRTCGAGLIMTADPAARAEVTDPVGIATGKFHGGATIVSLPGVNVTPSIRSSSSEEWA
ncbi:MAG: Uncharacterised protein [Cellulomonadaceae bacterium TMED98]|nr:MAG: Uncharacterised protein [Cellulomonadaceae bacterium TMED98]